MHETINTNSNVNSFMKYAKLHGVLIMTEYARIEKQPLRNVPKNRCSFFPGDIHIDVNPCTVLEQVCFPGGQQSWKCILLSKGTGQLFQDSRKAGYTFFCKQIIITEQLTPPVIDNLREQLEQLDFPGHESLLNLEELL